MVSIETIVFSALLGGARGFTGWIDNNMVGNDKTNFDFFKFAPTILGYVVFGALAEVAAQIMSLDIGSGESSAIGVAITEVLQAALKKRS